MAMAVGGGECQAPQNIRHMVHCQQNIIETVTVIIRVLSDSPSRISLLTANEAFAGVWRAWRNHEDTLQCTDNKRLCAVCSYAGAYQKKKDGCFLGKRMRISQSDIVHPS